MAEQQSFLIWPRGSDPGVSYGSLEMRRRIAQALASGKRPFPKTKGEGLTYLGESIGEGLQYLGLQRAEAERQKKLEKTAGDAVGAKSSEAPTSDKTSYDQTDNKPFPKAASDDAYNKDRPTQVVQAPAEAPAVQFSDVAPMQTTAAWPDTPTFSDRFAAASEPPPEATPVQTVSAAPSFSDRYAAVSDRPLQSVPAARAAVSSPEQMNTFFTPQMQASMAGGNTATAADMASPEQPVTLPTETADIPLPRGNPRTVGGTIATMEGTLARQGYAPNEIKGMIRNAYDESRFDWSPGSRHFDQPNFRGTEAAYSHGLFQEGGDEYNKMVAWRDKNYPGYSLDDPRLQTEYVGQRLQDPQYARTYAAMKGSDTPGQAADAFLRGYLKPAPQYQAQRSASYLRGDEPVYQQTAAVSRGGGGGGGGGDAGRVGGAPGDGRDAITEALLAQNQPQPQQAAQAPTQEEAVADNRLADVAGARRPGAPIFAPTAALGRTGIGTDAPVPGLSPMGSLGGGINQSIDARRNAISDALQNQQPTAPAVPPENPTQPGTSLSPTIVSPSISAAIGALPNPPVVTDIPPAPIAAGTRLAETKQLNTQPQPAPLPSPWPRSEQTPAETPASVSAQVSPYNKPVEPTPPQRLPRDEQELAAIRMKLANPGDPDVAQIADTILKDKEQKRNDIFQRDIEKYKSDLARYQADKAKYDEDVAGGYQKRALEHMEKVSDLELKQRTGYPDLAAFFKNMDKEKETAQQYQEVISSGRIVKSALDAGVFTGTAAGLKLNIAKWEAWVANNPEMARRAVNTEVLTNMANHSLAVGVRMMQGNDPRVSEGDTRIAAKIIAADPSLQGETIRQSMDYMINLANRRLNNFEDMRDNYLRGHRSERLYQFPVEKSGPDAYTQRLIANQTNPQAIAEYDARFGPGSAELEIGRARRQRRGP